ncbi:MAG TPA: FAD-dependent oxidoreductase [Terriglobia bacterium]|nr:FAD-dependent oxidoreductase [Terriglobia bacterium]
MRSERLLVIGGVAAGLSAASRARRVDPYLEIVVYEKGPDISYSACGIPYFIAGEVKDAGRLRVYSPEFFRAQRNIQVLTGHEVTEVSTSRRRVTVIAPGGAPLEEVHYDRLVLATGAEPARPRVPGLDLEGVFHVNDLQAALAFERYLDREHPRRALIIGGGYIGLEMADALVARGLEVTLADRGARLFEAVDEEISSIVEQELASHGVRVLKSTAVEALTGGRDRRVRRAIYGGSSQAGGDSGGPNGETDCVVLATGVRPRVKLAEDAGITLGATGAIAVDESMQTSAAAVFAAGDCVETRHRVSGRAVYFPLGTTANKQGRVAGENAAGGRARFGGIVGTAVVKVFGQEVARTGLSLAEAEAAGFAACPALVHAAARSRYLGGRDIVVKVVADRASGRLLGAQMAGPEGVAKRIDVFATALQARMTAEEASELDLSYAPPFSNVWDPVLIALQEMMRELRGRAQG